MARVRCFPYTPEFTPVLGAVDRPILPALYLIGPQGRLPTQPYVDMGADFSVFPAEFARIIGLDPEAGRPLPEAACTEAAPGTCRRSKRSCSTGRWICR